MLLFADQTITLYSKQGTTWARTVATDCSWSKNNAIVTVGTVTLGSDDFRVQIPEERLLECPQVGDVIVRGEVEDEIPPDTSATALLGKYKGRSFTIRLANDNTGSGKPLGHFVLVGK